MQHRSHIRCVCKCQLFSCSVIRDRVSCLDYRSSFIFSSPEKKIYLLNFHVIDIKHLFQCNRLLYYFKECFLSNTWAGQQYQYLKHGGDNPVANKKWRWGRLSQISRGKLSLVVCVCVCVCVCYNTIFVYTVYSRIHSSPETMHLYVYIKRKCFFSNIFERENFSAERCAFLYRSALN